MSSKSSLYTLFSSKINSLSSVEKQVFFWIDENASKVQKMTLVELAIANNVSTTTIIRLCHKLDLSGFSELKYSLPDVRSNNFNTEDPLSFFVETACENIKNIDKNQINQLVVKIKESPTIYIVCLGHAKTIGEYLFKSLVTKRKNVILAYDNFILKTLPQVVEEKSLVIIISDTGNTEMTIELAQHLHYRPVSTVAITNNTDGEISQFVDETIYSTTLTKDSRLKYAGFSLLFVIDMILNTYSNLNKE